MAAARLTRRGTRVHDPAMLAHGHRAAGVSLGLAMALVAPLLLLAPHRAEANTAPRPQAARPAAPAEATARRVAARAAPAAPALPILSDSPWDICAQAIAAAEQNSGLPPGLLGAIARVETGPPNLLVGRLFLDDDLDVFDTRGELRR